MSEFNWNDQPLAEEGPKGASGFRWEDHPIVSMAPQDEVPKAASASAGAISSLPFASQIGAAGKTGLDVITGSTPVGDAMDEYRNQRDILKGDLKEKMAANPKSALLGGVGGSVMMPLGSGAEAMAKYGGLHALGESDADLTKGEVAPALWDAAKGAAIGGAAGEAGDLISPYIAKGARSIGDVLRGRADKMYAASTKIPGATAYNKLKDNAPEVLRDYVKFGDTQGNIAKKLGAGFDDANEALSEARQAITNSGGGQSQEELISAMRSRAKELSSLDATRPLAEKLKAHADSLEKQIESGGAGSDVSMTDLGKNKSIYAENGKSVFNNPLDKSVDSELGNIYRNAEEKAASQSDSELNRGFLDSREKSSDLNQLAELAGKKASVYNQGPALNLHALRPVALGAALGGEEGYRHGGIPGALAGAVGGALIGPRVLASSAVTTNALSNIIKQAPEALGKYAPALEAAAARGGNALAATHKILSETDPEYRSKINQIQSGGGQ